MSAIRATYRLQLHRGFGLNKVRQLVEYFARLGVSHLYLSPVTRARAGSLHGYDVVDPRTVNPDVGTEQGLGRLAASLRRRGMGIVLDIVPNHMATGHENRYWEDVLTHGQASPFSRWFDVDWQPHHRRGRSYVLLPVLGHRLGDALAQRDLTLTYGDRGFRVAYHDASFPLDPATLPPALSRARSPHAARAAARAFTRGPAGAGRLRRLLGAQSYRLAHWRRAARELNYRRFFTINELIGLRVEDDAVWQAVHERLLDWLKRGWIAGLRIDHVDGLLDPLSYLQRLHKAAGPVPVFVEKILARHERLRDEWPVAGTTGYDFIAEVEDLFVDAAGFARVEERYRALAPRPASFAEAALWGKRRLLERQFVSEVRRLTSRLAAGLPRRERRAGDLAAAIRETIARLDVYRTYLDARSAGPDADDRAVLERAFAGAEATPVRASAIRTLHRALLGRPSNIELAQRFQQLCVSAAAKGVEDTALYVYVPLVARNEVGAAPDAPLADAPQVLHAANAWRARRWPSAMLAATTHDTKWSADLRSRLDVLSEIPEIWERYVRRWRTWHQPLRRRPRRRPAPDPRTEYLLYQALVGIWPAAQQPRGRDLDDLRRRVEAYIVKAAREGKRRTGWVRPNPEFESALSRFVGTILAPRNSRFLSDLSECVREVARPGFWNALARTLVHFTAPGIPDLYQGDELWNFAFVDPDNRRPVDFRRRLRLTAGRMPSPEHLASTLEDGRLKLAVVRAALALRRSAPRLFAEGSYQPLRIEGPAANHVFAFARTLGRQALVTIVPRLVRTLTGAPEHNPVGPVWRSTRVRLPARVASGAFRDSLTGRRVASGGTATLDLESVLARLPFALLVR